MTPAYPNYTIYTDTTYNTTTVDSSTSVPDKTMNVVSVFGIALGIVAVLTFVIAVVIFLAKCKHSQWLVSLRTMKRRSSSILERLQKPNEEDELPRRRSASELFSVADEDIDMRGGGACPDDGYFYDEIYDRSAFTDEITNTSMKELLTIGNDDIPDLTFRHDRK